MKIDAKAEESLFRTLASSGVTFYGWAEPPTIPTPLQAWSTVTRLGVTPIEKHECSTVGEKTLLFAAWMDQAEKQGVIDANGRFLISIGGLGLLPWASVSLQPRFDIGLLGPYPNEPEFVTISETTKRICAVTTEEDGIWVIISEA